jgi:hypothetical protein
MPTYREIFLENDEPPVIQPSLEDLLRPETRRTTSSNHQRQHPLPRERERVARSAG